MQAVDIPEKTEQNGSTISLAYNSNVAVIYDHSKRGLEQRIRLQKRLGSEGELGIRFRASSDFDYTYEDDQTSLVVSHDGTEVFGWRGLTVYDALGDKVPAYFHADNGFIEYRIDDSEAEYPLLVDPLAAAPSWQVSSPQGSSYYGRSATIVGDVNNDGYDDVLVGQAAYSNQESSEGRALLFLGSSNGLSNTSSWAAEGQQASAYFGFSISGIGDIDGDGFDDVVLGAFGYDDNGLTNSGAAFLYRGTSTGLTLTSQWTASSDKAGSSMGYGVAGMGDLNCDGINDLAVGSPGYDVDGDGTGSGRVWVYYGTNSSPYFSNTPDTIDEPNNGSFFGRNVYIRGNVDDDANGCDDLLIGAPSYTNTLSGEGKASIYLGSTSGINTTAAWTTFGDQAGAALGANVALADVNGDSIADVVVGADRYDTTVANAGQVRVYHGSTGGPSNSPDWTLDGTQDTELVGSGIIPVHHAGTNADINADGYADVVITAPRHTAQVSNEGAAFAFLGSSTGLSAQPQWTALGGEENSRFGLITISMGGDVNGDQRGDIVIGAIRADTQVVDGGTVYGFYGQSTCYINGTVYQDGEANPSNTCEVCDASQDVSNWSTLSDGATCDDGSACTSSDVCQSGVCQGSQSTTCNDNNPCTSDVCDPSNGQCVADPTQDGQPCPDDGLSCTSDICSNGTCEHVVNNGSCLINGACYADGDANSLNDCEICDSSVNPSGWSPASVGTSCSDGLFCTVGETCDGAGTCGNGAPRDCSSIVTGCMTGAECSEFSARCISTGDEPDGTSCDDNSACTTNDVCTSGTCGGTPVACNNPNPCEAGSCDPQTGSCSFTPVANGTGCTPVSNACQVGVCQSGVCSTTGTINCDDNNPCTADSCDPVSGCANDPLGAGAACGTASCVDETTAQPAATCSATAACETQATVDCGDFICDAGACLTSCSDDDDCATGAWCDTSTNECSTENRAPVADAGESQFVNVGMEVTLDGTGSYDDDGDPLTYAWTQLSGPGVTLADADTATPKFTAPAGTPGSDELVFELVVSDGTLDSTADAVSVLIRAEPNDKPTAAIDGPVDADAGDIITLLGAGSSDPDGDSLTYSWSRASGRPLPTLGDTSAEDFEVTFPEDISQETTYSFLLVVNDGNVNSDPAVHEVTVYPTGGDDVGPDTGVDAGPDVGDDVGDDAGSDAGGDIGLDDVGQPIDNQAGDLSGSSCACDNVQHGQPAAPFWLLGAVFLGGAAFWRRRRWLA